MAYLIKEKPNLLKVTADNLAPLQMAVRLIKRWMYAAKQDKDPYVAMLHINYAVGNSILLGEMFPPGVVKGVTGEHPYYLHLEASRIQDQVQKRLGIRKAA